MTRFGWLPPDAERAIGLEFYVTRSPGIAGTIKEAAEDFIVREISAFPLPDAQGPFTILRVVSRNWEQHELSERLAQRLGLPHHAIAWAGTKDRRAVAERLLSYRGSPPGADLSIPGFEILDAYRARDGLVLGHHYGNSFQIRIHLDEEHSERGSSDFEGGLMRLLEELRFAGGFANLFGPQRFGEVRPVTHEVGRWIVKGDLDRAVETYLVAWPGEPGTAGYSARLAYGQHRDPARALREFPPQFRFERELLDHLARGHSSERALRALAHDLRTLFVHAYQSLLFNRWLSRRHEAGISLVEPVPGDFLLRVARDGTVPGVRPVPVKSDNLEECRDWVRRGHARLAGPLVGFETPDVEGEGGAILGSLLREEGVDRAEFRLPQTPEIASRGSWRPVWTPLPPIGVQSEQSREGHEPAIRDVWCTFALPKGSYATVLLREFLKTGSRPLPGS